MNYKCKESLTSKFLKVYMLLRRFYTYNLRNLFNDQFQHISKIKEQQTKNRIKGEEKRQKSIINPNPTGMKSGVLTQINTYRYSPCEQLYYAVHLFRKK